MTNPELVNVLADLTGGIAHLSTEVGRLAAGQVSPAAIAELKAGQAVLQADVTDLKAGQAVLQADVADLKTDMMTVKADVAELKTDVAVLKTDVAELKTDVAVLKTDVAELKADMVTVKTDVQRIDIKTDGLADQLRLVAEGHGALLGAIATLRADTEGWVRDTRDFMIYMHKDLCARIDARPSGVGTPA